MEHTNENLLQPHTSGPRCCTMCLSICHLPSSQYLFLWSTPPHIVYLVLIVIIFFRLINHNNRIKTSACIHHISLATFAICFKIENFTRALLVGVGAPQLSLSKPVKTTFFIVKYTTHAILYCVQRNAFLFQLETSSFPLLMSALV